MAVDAQRADLEEQDGALAATSPTSLSTVEAAQEEPKAPAHGTRGTARGLRGCWAVNKRGEPCAAPSLKERDYCSAHLGLGISRDPAAYSKLGGEAASRKAAQRAELRLVLGVDRRSSPRRILQAQTALRAAEISGRIVDAVVDPKVRPEVAARLGLDLIDAVDPATTLTLTASMPSDLDGLNGLSLSQLQALAETNGLSEALPVIEQGQV